MEQWQDIIRYEGFYEISNRGRVRRIAPGHGAKPGKILKGSYAHKGYHTVTLCRDGICKTFTAHRLVAEHFLQNPNSVAQVHHKDGNKSNNNATNLEWVTGAQNESHAKTRGLKARGERHGNSRLNESDVREIRARYTSQRISQRQLARQYGVSQNQIWKILNGRSWKYLQDSHETVNESK